MRAKLFFAFISGIILLPALVLVWVTPMGVGQTPLASHLPTIEGEGFRPVASALKGKTRVPLVIPSLAQADSPKASLFLQPRVRNHGFDLYRHARQKFFGPFDHLPGDDLFDLFGY
jgi:hypothetical protein